MIARSRIFILVGFSVLGLGATMTLSSCTGSAIINVVNSSSTKLTNVVATGSGFTQSIGSIPAGDHRNVVVNIDSESALKIDFDANGKHHSSEPQGYFEGSKADTEVTATVSPNFTVTVDTKW